MQKRIAALLAVCLTLTCTLGALAEESVVIPTPETTIESEPSATPEATETPVPTATPEPVPEPSPEPAPPPTSEPATGATQIVLPVYGTSTFEEPSAAGEDSASARSQQDDIALINGPYAGAPEDDCVGSIDFEGTDIATGNKVVEMVKQKYPRFAEGAAYAGMAYFIMASDTSSKYAPITGASDPVVWEHLNDYGYPITVNDGHKTLTVQAAGCNGYAQYVQIMIYGNNGSTESNKKWLKKSAGETVTAESAKSMVQAYAQPGEHLRFNRSGGLGHSISFVAADDGGFYFLTYLSDTERGNPSKPCNYIRLQYADWAHLAAYCNTFDNAAIWNSDTSTNANSPAPQPTAEPTPAPTPKPPAAEVASGQCGDALTWTLDNKGTLTISGTGRMWDYSNPQGYGVPEGTEPFYPGWDTYKDSITRIVIKDGVTYIGVWALANGKAVESIELPASVKEIGVRAFSDNSKLQSINIPLGVETIQDYAFASCQALEIITLPDSLKYIGTGAFGSTAVKEIKIPDSVEQIGDFSGCKNLVDVFIPKSVTHINGGKPFFSCDNLINIEVDEENPVYCSIDGVLYDKEKMWLLEYPTGRTENVYTIPNGTKAINRGAFDHSHGPNTIVVPESLKDIGATAFRLIGYVVDKKIYPGLTSIYFRGNAPEFDQDSAQIFQGAQLTAYYPADNPTWTRNVMLDYGGNITWVPYTITDYKVIEGEDQEVEASTENEITFRANIDFEKFLQIMIDGNVVPADKYRAYAGSTYVSIDSDYLHTLSTGTHTLVYIATDGQATATFTIKKDSGTTTPTPTPPPTGDENGSGSGSNTSGNAQTPAAEPTASKPASTLAPTPAPVAAPAAYTGTIPQTADEFPQGGAVAAFGLSLAGLGALLLLRKKQR